MGLCQLKPIELARSRFVNEVGLAKELPTSKLTIANRCIVMIGLWDRVAVQPHQTCRTGLIEVDEVAAGPQEVAERFKAQGLFAE